MTYDVIIPNYVTEASLPIVLRCLYSVRRFSPDARLIFVDNGSPALDQILPELNMHKGLVKILNPTNLGFIKAVNQGIQASDAEYVVLLNNDTEVVPNWLMKMKAAFTGKVGIVGPRSQPNGTISSQLPYQTATILGPGEMLVFFCAMLSRAVIDKIGGLDEAFGIGLGDDDDYCWRAQQAGFDLCFLGDLTILHYHKTTFKGMYTPLEIRNMGYRAVDILRSKSEGASFLPQVVKRCPPR